MPFPPYLLGIDAGTTVTKAVLFDLTGEQISHASARVPLVHPAPHRVERDQDSVWDTVVKSVRSVLASSGADPEDVVSVGLTSHGDGVYLVDEAGRATRPGILSLDTRARDVVRRWDGDGTSEAAHALTGQRPWPAAPAALLSWLAQHEPETLARTRWALPCKDMIRMRMTGVAVTEPTEASLSFTDVQTQQYDDGVLQLYGLSAFGHLRAPIVGCTEISGRLTKESAAALGLSMGTLVAGSAHDVDASAIGSGVHAPGVVSVVAGSFSINQTISTQPCVGAGWAARNFVEPGRWMNMSISPTSATNMEWFTQVLCRQSLEAGAAEGNPLGFVEREIAAIEDDPSEVLYLPYLYGSPLPQDASASFIGLRGWHSRGHLLRAVMEGVAFTHHTHVARLDTAFDTGTVRFSGGASRSARWSAIFADVLGRPVEVAESTETGALGVALLAGVAAGVYGDLGSAVGAAVRIVATHQPDPERAAELSLARHRHEAAVRALAPLWGEETR